jgi:hypothetical protein
LPAAASAASAWPRITIRVSANRLPPLFRAQRHQSANARATAWQRGESSALPESKKHSWGPRGTKESARNGVGKALPRSSTNAATRTALTPASARSAPAGCAARAGCGPR